jgi:nanoRNase/pAp phosphatase (c-di-AMP/oligoRNAs hydrolase)
MSAPVEVLAALDDCDTYLLITHAHADLDTLGSAIGLRDVLDGDVRIVVPDGVGTRAQRLERALDVTLIEPNEIDPSVADCAIVTDTSSSDRIEPFSIDGFAGTIVVIDHHHPGDLTASAVATYVDTELGATAALVARTIETSSSKLTPKAAVALAAGLIDDTGFLTTATPEESVLLADLLDVAGDRATVLPEILKREPSFGERVAKTKAVVRSTGFRADKTLILLTEVSGEQSAAAQALRDAGADIALVVSDRGSQVWVVGRAESDTIHLPEDVFDPLLERFGGHGGGHAEAGVAKFDTGTPSDISTAVRSQLETALGSPLSEIS